MFAGASVLAAFFALSAPGLAQDACYDLWFERNQIYKDAGYCFRTTRAIRTFGNAGCAYDNERDVPLSSQDRRRIAQIVQMERRYGCQR
jgi:hypothetical protein